MDHRIDQDALLDDFLRYVRINTRSDPSSKSYPSTAAQLDFASMLAGELKGLGLDDARVDKYGYVMATLPANTSNPSPIMGLIAHMDTSPDMSGEDVKPQIHRAYDGTDLVLNSEAMITMRADDFPLLRQYTGQTIITSDGTTLLGADNKAGIAEIMAALRFFRQHPDYPHGTIRVAFTPDEEIGKGTQFFDVKKFAADFAYTVDGGEVGELQYENFHAAEATLLVHGTNIHPGEAKDKMVNASLLGAAFLQKLPERERPEHSTGYEGFYHLVSFRGEVEQAELRWIIRDFELSGLRNRQRKMEQICQELNGQWGKDRFRLETRDQYYNMLEKLSAHKHVIELAREAMLSLGIEPLVRPIRGGTDGARLSYTGLPCPNLFTGGHHFHGRYEFIPLESMVLASRLIIQMAGMLTEKHVSGHP